MTLQRHHHIQVSRQSTKSIIAMILEAAELVRVDLPALHALKSQTKKMICEKVTNSIHFIFFTRETARKHQGVTIPF